jgi:hypothetical protein
MSNLDINFNVRLSQHERDWLVREFQQLTQRMVAMSAELDALVAQVQANHDEVASAITFIQGLGAQLADVQAQLAAGGVTNAKLAELTATMTQDDAALGAVLAPPATP